MIVSNNHEGPRFWLYVNGLVFFLSTLACAMPGMIPTSQAEVDWALAMAEQAINADKTPFPDFAHPTHLAIRGTEDQPLGLYRFHLPFQQLPESLYRYNDFRLYSAENMCQDANIYLPQDPCDAEKHVELEFAQADVVALEVWITGGKYRVVYQTRNTGDYLSDGDATDWLVNSYGPWLTGNSIVYLNMLAPNGQPPFYVGIEFVSENLDDQIAVAEAVQDYYRVDGAASEPTSLDQLPTPTAQAPQAPAP